MKKVIALTITLLFSQMTMAQIFDPGDTIVQYDPLNPPPTPSWGTMAKWVITPQANFDTEQWKAYYYNQVPFRLRFPNNYDPSRTEAYPVAIVLHGRGFNNGTIYMNDRHLINAGAEAFEDGINDGSFDGFIICPQGTSGYFGDGQFNALEQIITQLDLEHNIDLNRISVNGRSAGAQAVWRFITAKPKLLAAALPMSGAFISFAEDLETYKHLSIWLFQGGLDTNPRPSTSEDLIDSIVSAGGYVRYSIWPNVGHGVFDVGYDEPDFFDFMDRARKFNPIVLKGNLILVDQDSQRDVYEYIPKNEFCPGEEIIATLAVTPGFDGYEWRKDNQLIANANSNELNVTELGSYDVRIQRGSDWSPWSTEPIEIAIKDITQTPDIQVNGLISKVIPSPDGSTSVDLILPAGFTEYNWFNVGDPTIIGTDRVFTANAPGLYEASVTEPYGCDSNNSQPFIVVDANGNNAPDPAIGLVGFAPSKTSLELNWSDNPTPNFNETGFEIYTSETSGGPYSLLHITNADELSFIHSGLLANSTHYYIVRAINENGAASITNEITLTTQVDETPPTAPSNLRIVKTSTNYVELAWDAATDDVGVWRYDVYRNDVKTVVTENLNITAFNLIPDQIYNFKIKARDITGNESEFSNQAIAATVFEGTPLAYLQFENDFEDSSPNGVVSIPRRNNLSFENTIVAKGNASLRVGNPNAYVDLDTDNQFVHDEFATRSFAFWVYPDNVNGIQDIIDEGGSTNGIGFRINNGNVEFGVQDNQVINTIAGPITSNAWNYIAGTFDNGTIKLYINAVEVASLSGLSYQTVSAHGNGAGIGGSNSSNAFDVISNNFTGYVDDFYIDDDVLVGPDITGLMNGTSISIPDERPEPPTNAVASATSYDEIELTWVDNSTDETGFQVYRSTTDVGPYLPVGMVAPDQTYFSDNGLESETTYFYKVISLGQYGESMAPTNFTPSASLNLDSNSDDGSENNVASSPVNNPVFDSGQFIEGNGSMSLSSNNDYIDFDIGDLFVHTNFSTRSVSMWIYADNTIGIQDIFDEGGSTNGFGIRINNGNIEGAVQDNNVMYVISAPITSQEWRHATLVFDSGKLQLYLEEQLVSQIEDLSYTFVNDHGGEAGIGASNGSNAFDQINNNFNGQIDYFNFYNGAINSTDIANLMNGAHTIPSATTGSLPPPPNAPSNLTATATSGTSIELNWSDNSDDETNFIIERSTGNSSNYLPIETLGINATNSMNYSDVGLFSNVDYYYQVKAVNAGGESASNVANDRTLNTSPTLEQIGDIVMQAGTELVFSVIGYDPDPEQLILSGTNLPTFVQLLDHGDGTGSLTLSPGAGDGGIFGNVQITIADENNGSFSEVLTIEVNGNNVPEIDPVADLVVEEGALAQIIVTANDLDGNEDLVWNISGLPAFASYDADLDGNATIDLDPDYVDHGIYDLTVTVSDQYGASDEEQFAITVNDIDPNQRISINFQHNTPASAPWNNVNTLNNADLLDTDGAGTGVALDFLTNTWKSFKDGAITGDDSGIYPDNAIKDYYYFGIFGAPETIDILISGLDPSRTYSFDFLGSSVWGGTPDNGNTDYTIDGQTVSLYVQGNNQNLASFSGLNPQPDGSITITLSKGSGASVGYINAMEIETLYNDGTPPSAPHSLEATLDAELNLNLTWIDAPYNEEGFRLYKAQDGVNFTLRASLPANATSYQETEITDNETYYYYLIAHNSFGDSDPSNIVNIAVPNTPPTLDPVGDHVVSPGQVLVVPISATDPPANNITLSAVGLPSFVSLNDFGSGNGELVIAGSAEDIGSYENIQITVTDDAGDSRTEIISITVSQDILYSVYVNFNKNHDGSSPWNNTGKAPQINDVFGDLSDDFGANSGLSITLTTSYGGVFDKGANTGDDSGIVPDNVLKEYYWFGIFSAPPQVQMKVSGLNPLEQYNFKFVGSSEFTGGGVTDNGETLYRIGNEEVSVDVQSNTSETGVINGVTGNSQGEVIIDILKGTGAPAGYINALVIEAYGADQNTYVPSNVKAVGISSTDVQVNWTDNSPDETSFEIFRATESDGVYSLIGTVAADEISFVDGPVTSGTIYFYRVRAVRLEGPTDLSDYSHGAAILFSVLVNINGDQTYNAAIPWNNLGVLPGNGQIFTGLKDMNNNETGIAIRFVQTMTGSNDWGAETGNNSGVYPDAVLKSFFFNNAQDIPANIVAQGLDQSLNYNFSFFGSIVTGYNIRTNFTIENITVTNSQTDNISEVSTIYGIAPDVNGETHITVQEDAGSNWAIFNAMVIDAYPVPPNASQGARTAMAEQAVPDENSIRIQFGKSEEQIRVYPVPFNEFVTIQFPDITTSEIKVQIRDVAGKNVATSIQKVNFGKIELDFRQLDEGVYFIRLALTPNDIRTIPIIKGN